LPRLDGEPLLARRSDLVVAVAAAEARTVVDRLGAAPEAVRVVHPGVDSEMFHPGEGSARPTLLAAARLEPLKAIDLAIRTLAGVVERDGEPRPRLVVAGGATSDESYPRERSEEHTSELQSRENLVCRLLLEKKKGKP